jgi:hypothetical protein
MMVASNAPIVPLEFPLSASRTSSGAERCAGSVLNDARRRVADQLVAAVPGVELGTDEAGYRQRHDDDQHQDDRRRIAEDPLEEGPLGRRRAAIAVPAGRSWRVVLWRGIGLLAELLRRRFGRGGDLRELLCPRQRRLAALGKLLRRGLTGRGLRRVLLARRRSPGVGHPSDSALLD